MFCIIKKIWNDVCRNTHNDNNNNSKLHIRLSPASLLFPLKFCLFLSLPQKDKETKNLRRICNKLLTSSNRIKSKKKSAKSRKKLVENFQRGSKVRHSKTNLFYDVSAINPEDRSNATAGLFQMKKVGKKKSEASLKSLNVSYERTPRGYRTRVLQTRPSKNKVRCSFVVSSLIRYLRDPWSGCILPWELRRQ